ncbi:hypothetical protein AB9P05_04380 [Roseivirga sp. BDSF3-8]|uniref:hypothetical protein n=1 Tax=Roseivirga sp. BDSF3-8 TaxID=3241598 RepID=UPI00353277B3
MKKNTIILPFTIIGILAFLSFACSREEHNNPFYFINKHKPQIGFVDFNIKEAPDSLGEDSFLITLKDCSLSLSETETYNDVSWEMAEDINEAFVSSNNKDVWIRFEFTDPQTLHPKIGESKDMTVLIRANEL